MYVAGRLPEGRREADSAVDDVLLLVSQDVFLMNDKEQIQQWEMSYVCCRSCS